MAFFEDLAGEFDFHGSKDNIVDRICEERRRHPGPSPKVYRRGFVNWIRTIIGKLKC